MLDVLPSLNERGFLCKNVASFIDSSHCIHTSYRLSKESSNGLLRGLPKAPLTPDPYGFGDTFSTYVSGFICQITVAIILAIKITVEIN